ncbi:hypothetical protein CKM354_000444600 [Cercospora kikuchii]|uniref:Uncharacterized protein n=1 Tax=Cercospora kikuchii TaxID=84275 RepID=A0A9P3FG58_9PEZI|nr:uncharacterized protein CKM354_000444600 [Cercospora kikuchii]GIZ41130.1 hypothetical protein CKM354_000444600 [Cercospora kikuchii]
MSTSEASHGAEQQSISSGYERSDIAHDDKTANASTAPSLLRSAPLIVDYLAQLRLASFSEEASQIRLHFKESGISKLESDTIFDAIGQLVIKTNGAFESATEKVREINMRLHKDEQLVIVRQNYDYWSIDDMETRLDLEAMQNFMKGLAASVNEIKEGFVVVHDVAQEIKSAVVNDTDLGTVQVQQNDTPAAKPQAIDQNTSEKTIVNDFQAEAQNALESLRKLNQQVDEESEQSGFQDVGIKALTGLKIELTSIMDYFQTLSVQLDGMSDEMAQKFIDLRHSDISSERSAAERREFLKYVATCTDATGVSFPIFEDLLKDFIRPSIQSMEILAMESTSEQRKRFKKYYRNAMKGYTQATENLAEKSNDEILVLLKAGVSVVDMREGQRTHEVQLGDQKKGKDEPGAGAQQEVDSAADDSYGDGPMLGSKTEVFGTDEGGESEAARKLGQSAARVTKMFDNEIGLADGQFDHKVFK